MRYKYKSLYKSADAQSLTRGGEVMGTSMVAGLLQVKENGERVHDQSQAEVGVLLGGLAR